MHNAFRSALFCVALISLGCAHHRGQGEAVVQPGDKQLPARPERMFCGGNYLNNILFSFDSSVLSAEGMKTANQAGAELRKWPKDTVVIEGHTCDIGTSDYNLALGAKRAETVANYLKSQGFEASRIRTTTYGEEVPAVPNDSEKNRALNRRAVFNFGAGN